MDDEVVALPAWKWLGQIDAGDSQLLDRCVGPTVDIGCGPGRMTNALLARGVQTLGIDVVAEAVELTRARGGVALQRDVFTALPGEGRWQTALLADGNIGIGGDPVRLLQRTARLLRADGRIVVDLSPPGGDVRVHRISLEVSGARSRRFPWAIVPADRLACLAEAAALRVSEVVEHDGRWFAALHKSVLTCPH